MSNIRVTYSGLLAFVVGLTGIFTGIIFTILVTRKLTPEELGLWTLIGSLVSYVVIIEPIISFWTTRQIARGEQVAKTSVATSGLFSVAAIIVYGGIAVYISSSLDVDFFPIILAAFLVPLSYLTTTLNSIALSHKPQTISYGMIVFEVSKLPLGFLFVYSTQFGLVGAIIATIIASLARTIVLIFFVREVLVDFVKINVIKFWLRLSWLPIYTTGSGFIFTLDVLIFTLLTNSLTGLAFWGVANAVASLVSQSAQISQALYPKILATRKKEIAEENLKKLLFFAIPLLAASIVFAKPALYILNPIYVGGIFIVYFLAIRSFMHIIRSIAHSILASYETVDVDKNVSLKKIIKSKLFFLPTLDYALRGSYVGILVLFLIISQTMELNDVELVTYWSLILPIVTAPFMIYGVYLLRKNHQINLPYVSMLKFAVVALLSSIISYFMIENYLIYYESIFDFLPHLLPFIIMAGVIYFGVSYTIDKSTRELFKLIIKEMKPK